MAESPDDVLQDQEKILKKYRGKWGQEPEQVQEEEQEFLNTEKDTESVQNEEIKQEEAEHEGVTEEQIKTQETERGEIQQEATENQALAQGQENEIRVKTEKELLEEAYLKEEDTLKKAEIRRRIEEIERKEQEDARVSAEQINAQKENEKAEQQQRRARSWANLKNAGSKYGKGAATVGRYGAAIAQDIGVASSQGLFIILSMLLFVSDFLVTRFNGIDFVAFLRSLPMVWIILRGGVFTAILITLAIIYVAKRPDGREFGSWVILIVVLYLSLALTSFNSGAITHIIFAALLLLLYISPIMEDKASANFAIALMVFIDFFGFSLFSWLGQMINFPALGTLKNRLLFPFWTIFLLVYPPGLKKTKFVKFLTFVFVLFYLFLFVMPNFSYTQLSSTISQEQMVAGKDAVNIAWTNMQNFVISIATKGEKGTQKMIALGAGPYYTGVVDDNEKKPLGVTISKNAKPIYPEFSNTDPVELDTQVTVNALGEPVKVAMGCKVKDTNGSVSPDYDPNSNINFDIAESESVPIACTFAPGSFAEGAYRADITADYNFVTYAYIQRYFIDETTVRQTTAQNVAITTLLKGFDANPVSHSTGGPVKITMTPIDTSQSTTNSPIIPVKADRDTLYRFGFDIQNNPQSLAGGVIKQLNDVILLIPDSMNLGQTSNGYDCSHKFIDASVNDCLAECDNSEQCNKICQVAFDGHKGYKLDPDILKTETRLQNIQDSRTFSCGIIIPVGNRQNILGQTSPNTLEFRTIAKYDYSTSEKSLPFDIKLKPGYNVIIEPSAGVTSSNNLICRGLNTEKSINKATYQFFSVVNGEEQQITEPKAASCDTIKKTCKGEIPKQKRGLTVKCTMIFNDDPTVYSSQNVLIKNSPPIVTAYFEPSEPLANQELTCKGNVTDEDGDAVGVTYDIESIKEPDALTKQFKMETNNVDCPRDATIIGHCSIPIDATEVIAKRLFRCKLVPYDNSAEDNRWGDTSYAIAYVAPLQQMPPVQVASQPQAPIVGSTT